MNAHDADRSDRRDEPFDEEPFDEEPWEQEVARLLANLPEVEPPPGFFEAAIDRPPHHFGRAVVGALGATLAALVGAVVMGVIGPGQAELSLDWMADRHAVAASAMRSGAASVSPKSLVGGDAQLVEETDDSLDLPTKYERRASFLVEDLRQAVYSRGDDAVTVFEQPGRVDTDALVADGLVPLRGTPAWYDPARELMVVETTEAAVAVVGLDEREMMEVLADAEPRRTRAIEAAISELTSQLGFPE